MFNYEKEKDAQNDEYPYQNIAINRNIASEEIFFEDSNIKLNNEIKMKNDSFKMLLVI
jgi:hypothetical protein